MPCSDAQHRHSAWPIHGRHQLVIEACETQCGWCRHIAGSANNLRSHARRHIANPKAVALKDIRVVHGKAGRSRVAVRSREPGSPPPHSEHDEAHMPKNAQQLYDERMAQQAALYANALLRSRIQYLEDLLHKNNIQLPVAALSELPLPTPRSLPRPSTAPEPLAPQPTPFPRLVSSKPHTARPPTGPDTSNRRGPYTLTNNSGLRASSPPRTNHMRAPSRSRMTPAISRRPNFFNQPLPTPTGVSVHTGLTPGSSDDFSSFWGTLSIASSGDLRHRRG